MNVLSYWFLLICLISNMYNVSAACVDEGGGDDVMKVGGRYDDSYDRCDAHCWL